MIPESPDPSAFPFLVAITRSSESPSSTSVSFSNTLPSGLSPSIPLFIPPFSIDVAMLLNAIGASLAPSMVMVSVAISFKNKPSTATPFCMV